MEKLGLCSRAVLLFTMSTGCAASARPVPFADNVGPYHDGARLVVVGDMQRTAPLLEFWREQNDDERAAIVRAIGQASPDLLVITGDCVFDGGSDAQWEAFDKLVEGLHARHLPAIAALGNHEYWMGRRDAEDHFFPRFPLDAHRRWFTFSFGPLRIVTLDGNQNHFSSDEWQLQVEWYRRELACLDAEPSVRGVLVMLHQPPYTNSTATGDELYVQEDLVPPLVNARKTMAMLSGHVHSYERYIHEGKMFVVSGGGGGPRHRLATGCDRRHPDDLFNGPPIRDFHFTVYTVGAAGVQAEVRGVAKGEESSHVMDRFALPWPGCSLPGPCPPIAVPTGS